MIRRVLCLAVLLGLAAPALAQSADAPRAVALAGAGSTPQERVLEAQITSILDSDTFSDAYWGALVVDLTDGRVLYSRNADRRFIPASNMKLVSTAAALDALGPDFRYQTRLYADGEVRGTTLHGSLVVEGSGDPTFGGRYADGDATRVFRAWADSLKAAGILRVTGAVIGDDDVFDDEALGKGWMVEDLVWYYGAEISGLQYNEGTARLDIRGTRPGRAARIMVEPDVDYIQLANQTVTTAGGKVDAGYRRALDGNLFTVSTRVPAGTTESEDVSVRNPTAYFAHALRRVLERSGIQVDGGAVDVDEWGGPPLRYAPMRRIATHESPRLVHIVAQTNIDSNNLYAEHLLRTLAVHRYAGDEHPAGSARAGAEAAAPFLVRAGIDPASLSIVDGSGLSGMNRLTPRALIALLTAMKEHPDPATARGFEASLPVGGRSGTLERRYKSGDARHNVRAKTGFITGARTLSGYVDAANGHTIAFSLLCNNYSVRTSRVNRAQDDIVELLADFDG